MADDPVAQGDGALQRPATKIERAVAQTQVLVHRGVLVDRERRRVGVGQDLECGHGELDLPGGQVRVDVLGRPARDLAGGRDHVLGAQPVRGGVGLGRGIGMEHELDDPRALPQVDEDQTAVVATAVHPARDTRASVPARPASRSPAQVSRKGLGRGLWLHRHTSRLPAQDGRDHRLGLELGLLVRIPCP